MIVYIQRPLSHIYRRDQTRHIRCVECCSNDDSSRLSINGETQEICDGFSLRYSRCFFSLSLSLYVFSRPDRCVPAIEAFCASARRKPPVCTRVSVRIFWIEEKKTHTRRIDIAIVSSADLNSARVKRSASPALHRACRMQWPRRHTSSRKIKLEARRPSIECLIKRARSDSWISNRSDIPSTAIGAFPLRGGK